MKEFHIVLNITEFSLQNPDWKRLSDAISRELNINEKISADVSVGAYASIIPQKKFFLFALPPLQLAKADDLKKYKETEIKIENVLKKHFQN